MWLTFVFVLDSTGLKKGFQTLDSSAHMVTKIKAISRKGSSALVNHGNCSLAAPIIAKQEGSSIARASRFFNRSPDFSV